MVRAVQEGARENKDGVVFWMFLTVLGGLGFLGCQAWEWTELIGHENMSVTRNTFGTHTENGVYLNENGGELKDEDGNVVRAVEGKTYLIHRADFAGSHSHAHGDDGHHGDGHGGEAHGDAHGADAHGGGHAYDKPGDYKEAVVDDLGFIHRKFKVTEGEDAGMIKSESFGPKSFGALFFFITGFHGTHVLSGVIFLLIIMLNVRSGLYVERKNKYEMVEKIGLYWHFVDLVWVFVFLVFYLI